MKNIDDTLINEIKVDIEKEKQTRILKKLEQIPNSNTNSYQELKEKSEKYKVKYNLLKTNINLRYDNFNNIVNELLDIKNSLGKYGYLFSDEAIKVKELNIPQYCDKIKFEGHEEINIGREDINKGIYYLSEKYNGTKIVLFEGERQTEMTLIKSFEIKNFSKNKLNQALRQILERNRNISIRQDKIKINLEISEKPVDINKKEKKEGNLLYDLKTIVNKTVENTKKVANHLNDEYWGIDGNRIIMLLKSLTSIRTNFEKVSLKNPKLTDEQSTELENIKRICEDYENYKSMLLEKFDLALKEFGDFNSKIEKLKNDNKIVSGAFKLNNVVKLFENNDEIDFSTFKEFKFRSTYIALSNDGKTFQTSYPTFIFNLGNIIPSLYGNSTYTVNIISFINKTLKVEILKDSIDSINY